MSEKKRDLRGYLPPAIYAAMEVKLEAEGEGETVAAYLERLVTKDVGDWLHRTSVAADKLHRRGILRSAADSLGVPRK